MHSERDRAAAAASWVAAALGVASAVTSAYWAAGGRALLDTVGGTFEEWGRDRTPAVVVALAGIAVLKVVVALAAPILAKAVAVPSWMTGRLPRALGWIAAVVLTIYGGVLTGAGVLVETGVIDAAADADHHALAWHTWFWDPWFFLWGLAFVIGLWRSGGRASSGAGGIRHVPGAGDALGAGVADEDRSPG